MHTNLKMHDMNTTNWKKSATERSSLKKALTGKTRLGHLADIKHTRRKKDTVHTKSP
uniref:Uncharacterized protein n=1 Tax=Arion vulgaris TaxID=1028688 RepID=A0A0B7B4P2_9EUPU